MERLRKGRRPGGAELNSPGKIRMKSKQPQKNKKAICRPTQNNWHQMNRKQRREMTRKIQSEDLSLEVVHPHVAGIDIGNESHYVACRRHGTANPYVASDVLGRS
jgi:hypothetical protein